MAALGDAARAVVVVDQTVGDAEPARLAAGARHPLSHAQGRALPWETLEDLAARVHPFEGGRAVVGQLRRPGDRPCPEII